MGMTIEAVIFTFNRGRLLRNCIASVGNFMPDVPVTVFDDRSTDPETLEILEEVGREGGIQVLTGPARSEIVLGGASVYGGLYENIQSFVDVHARSSLAIFLQDDTQAVRTFTQSDREALERIFSDYPQAAFIYPAFLTHNSYSEFLDPASLAMDGLSFTFRYDYEFSGYFDVCIAHIDRLRAARWRFGDELQTSLRARDRFGTMRLMRQPFIGHLPFPPTYRNRRQTWTGRAWERCKAGLYPIDSLSDSSLQRLSSMKDPFPTAEKFLTSERFPGAHPWPYGTLEGAPGVLQFINRVESKLRRELIGRVG